MKVLEFTGGNLEKKIEDRIIKCFNTSNCQCDYCFYRKKTADKLIDFLCEDIVSYEKLNHKMKFCIYDIKAILYAAIIEVKRLENELN